MPDSLNLLANPVPSPDALTGAGYRMYTPPDPFEDHAGPIWYRKKPDVHCVMPVMAHHKNAGGVVHGGAIMTFADYALCTASSAAVGVPSFSMTVSLTVEFLDAGVVEGGPALEADGRASRVTGSLAFVSGDIRQGGRRLASYSGVCRHISREKAMARRTADSSVMAVPRDAPPFELPDGYKPVLRSSAFMHHIGATYFKPTDGGVHVIQPVAPHMLNSGASIHGGMQMTFADNAFCTAITATTGKAPATVMFTSEFISAGTLEAPLETLVDLARIGKSMAFVRGLVRQAGRPLLNYSAVVALRDWKPGTTPMVDKQGASA